MTPTSPAVEPQDQRPAEVTQMRVSARRLLRQDAELPTVAELERLTLLLRGHAMRLIPDVEAAAAQLPEDDVPRACALACIGEARMRLNAEPRPGLPAQVIYAQHLARSVNALCDHVESLRSAHS